MGGNRPTSFWFCSMTCHWAWISVFLVSLPFPGPAVNPLCFASQTSDMWLLRIFIISIKTAWPQSLSSAGESPYLGLWWASFLIVLLSVQESEWAVIRVNVTQSLSVSVKNISATTEKFSSFKKPDQVYIISLLLVFHMCNEAIAMRTTMWWVSLY